MSNSTWTIIFSIVFGGVSASAISLIFNRRLEREKRSLEFVRDYFGCREKIGRAFGFLQNPTSMTEKSDRDLAMSIIQEVADRLNFMAYYYNAKLLKRSFIDESGAIVDVLELLTLIDKAQQEPQISAEFEKAGVWWAHLFDLRNRRVHPKGES